MSELDLLREARRALVEWRLQFTALMVKAQIRNRARRKR